MENQEEIWKDMPDYEGYCQVSNLGRIKRVKDFFIYKQQITKKRI